MTEFAADYAAADLNVVEHAALRGLATLGANGTIYDLADFTAGFCRVEEVSVASVRLALFALDALGWVRCLGPDPQTDVLWRITAQGRIALERRP